MVLEKFRKQGDVPSRNLMVWNVRAKVVIFQGMIRPAYFSKAQMAK